MKHKTTPSEPGILKTSKPCPVILFVKTGLTMVLLFISTAIYSQNKVSGKITDEKGNPMPGVNMYIKQSYDGASTDNDGNYLFYTQKAGQQVLVAAFIGYNTIEQSVELHNETKVDLKMAETTTLLNAVVITAGSYEASGETKSIALKPLDIVTTASATGDLFGAIRT